MRTNIVAANAEKAERKKVEQLAMGVIHSVSFKERELIVDMLIRNLTDQMETLTKGTDIYVIHRAQGAVRELERLIELFQSSPKDL